MDGIIKGAAIILFVLICGSVIAYIFFPDAGVFKFIAKSGILGTKIALESFEVNESAEVVQFAKNLRFNDERISYFINENCDSKKTLRYLKALNKISSETEILSFFPADEKSADILVGCSKDSYEDEQNVFVSGEGGPTAYFELGYYSLIEKSKVLLYEQDKCDEPVTELHEMFHALGFDHISNSNLIMYPYISCGQKINPELIKKLIEIYSAKSLPELSLSNISAVKNGKYLNFQLQINNNGIAVSKNAVIEIYADNNKINILELGEINPGSAEVDSIQNLLLPSENTARIKFVIVTSSEEYSKENNAAEVVL